MQNVTFIGIDICHRIAPLHTLYAMTVTFILKIKHNLAKHLPLKMRKDSGCPPADLPRLSHPLAVELLFLNLTTFLCGQILI